MPQQSGSRALLRPFNRRRFLQTAGSAAILPAVLRGYGAQTSTTSPNNRINVGVIGMGWQGPGNTDNLLTLSDCQVVAACDIDSDHLQAAVKKINDAYGNEDCKGYHDYRELLAREDIDAVMHTDEAVNAYIVGQLLSGEAFSYDPQDRHGPALAAIALPLSRIRGARTFSDLTEADLRLSSVLAGTVTILLFGAAVNMGFVYEAFDKKRNQRIAIKAAKPGYYRLLSPELQGALRVRHPNVCLVNEIHTTETAHGEIDFLTMELLDGETLAARLETEGKLPDNEAFEIACQICSGLASAHGSGVIHRDLKPGNIMLCRTPNEGLRVVIMDFGLAGLVALDSLEGGTPGYM